jgi:hypothetical protein
MSVDFFTAEQSAPVGSSSPDVFVPVLYVSSHEQPSYVLDTGEMPPSFSLELRRGDGYWTVTDGPTGIFGQGSDVLAAIRDFSSAVAEHLDVLERQRELSEELAWQLDYLRARVRR